MRESVGRSSSPVFSAVSPILIPAVSLLLLLFAGCASAETVELTVGSAAFTVEIADTADERARGLMNRRTLPEDRGMLFVFPRDQKVSFWMKNTTIPLTVAYIARDGRIVELHDLEPLSQVPVPSRRSVRYALELNRGAFERAGAGVGDRVSGLP